MAIKLSEYCRGQGIKYITGYRWFKEGKMPANVHAYQAPSGAIFVEEVEKSLPQEQSASLTNTESVSIFLNGMVEHSLNNASVEQFAGYVLSNFQLQSNTTPITYNATNSMIRSLSLNNADTNDLYISSFTSAQSPIFDAVIVEDNDIKEEEIKVRKKRNKK